MLTDGARGVNTPPPSAVMLSIAALAKRDGVTPPAVSRKVKQLVAAHGLTVTRDAQGRVSGVHSVEYDHLRNRFDDPSKAQAPASSQPAVPAPLQPAPPNESYDEALRQKTWVEAERSRLRLAAERGEYLKGQDVTDALVSCGEEIVRTIDRLGASIDDMAAAVARDGVHGLRMLIKSLTFRMKTDVANALQSVAAPQTTKDGKAETAELAEVDE